MIMQKCMAVVYLGFEYTVVQKSTSGCALLQALSILHARPYIFCMTDGVFWLIQSSSFLSFCLLVPFPLFSFLFFPKSNKAWVASQEVFGLGLELDLYLWLSSQRIRKGISKLPFNQLYSNAMFQTLTIHRESTSGLTLHFNDPIWKHFDHFE